MRLAPKLSIAVLCAALCAGALSASGSAAFRPTGVVPLFCTSDTIPAGGQLFLRMRWVVRNSGQADKFLSSQKLAWTVSTLGGGVLASHVPSQYGDGTFWSPKVHSSTVDLNADGVLDDVYYMDYQAPTGLAIGSSVLDPLPDAVSISYTLTANAKTDDGFGSVFGKFQTISAGSSCTVTGLPLF